MIIFILNLYKKAKKHIPIKTKRKIKKALCPFYKFIFISGYAFLYSACELLGIIGLIRLKIKMQTKPQSFSFIPGYKSKKKKIGIDARPLQMIGSRSRGIGYYTKNLINGLSQLKNNKYEFVFYSIRDDSFNDSSNTSAFQYIIKRKSQRLNWLWNTAFLPSKILDGNVGLFHATDPFCIVKPTSFYRTVVTVYDVIPLLYPQKYLLPTTLYRRYAYTHSYSNIPFADAVITISEASKKDISKILNIPLEQIHVTYLATDERFKPICNLNVIAKKLSKYHFYKNYILYVGGVDYRKNLISLLKSFALIIQHFKNLFLVIVGNDIFNPSEPMYKKLHQTIRDLNLNKHIALLGFVSTEELVRLYAGAKAFIFPSLYEGFGLPVLEAMASGCPVICSNISSLPEVVGNAALFVHPTNIQEMAQAIKTVLTNKDIANRLKALGLSQSKKFSWEQTVRKTTAIYENIYSQHTGLYIKPYHSYDNITAGKN